MEWYFKEAEEDLNLIWDFCFSAMDTPYWERDREANARKLQELIESAHPLVKSIMPNYTEADVRYWIMVAQLRQTRIAAALAAYRLDKGNYPANLSMLVPGYLQSKPADPFSGKGFAYSRATDGNSYRLHSIGPDMNNQKHTTAYDPTNGTISAGDVFFR